MTSVRRAHTHKSNLPIYLLLLSYLAHLQVHHRVLITVGFTPGALNIVADATSRNFLVPNGPAIRESLKSVAQLSTGPKFIELISLGRSSSNINLVQMLLTTHTNLARNSL